MGGFPDKPHLDRGAGHVIDGRGQKARGQILNRTDMRAHGNVDVLKNVVADHCQSTREVFFARLKNEFQNPSFHGFFEAQRGREQHAAVSVVPAGVHGFDSPFSVRIRQGVHVGAEKHDRTGPARVDHRHDTVAADVGAGFKAELGKGFGDVGAGSDFLAAQFSEAVQVVIVVLKTAGHGSPSSYIY